MKPKNTITMITIAALVVLGALVVVRGTRQVQAKETATAVVLPTAQADSAELPPGVYSTTITEADLPPGLPPEFVAILVGEWQTEFTEAGTTIVTKDGDIVVVGRYTSSPTRVVMTDLQGALACTDAPGIATGIYDWSLENNQLTLTAVRDRCDGRHLVLTAHPLQKQ